eukprot:CAMPEP_0113463046 /NCGR_PEP_ID=MMETSP0014_2-20120614/12433_1 /TAXON_ID=2857 /ORGANISM="Nitzschia sp." /LENGTH=271 /DNA_ID=CAMNT_0000354983 /DNA_START=98 /DNA_END=913 /DNA_ORIENTATION=- /assembly_acc=CAM_ASM_000159
MSDLDECMLSKCRGGFRLYNDNNNIWSGRGAGAATIPASAASTTTTTTTVAVAVATTSHPAGQNRSCRRWSKAEKEAFEELLPMCKTSTKCMKEMAASLNSRFPNNETFTAVQCQTQHRLLKRTLNKRKQKQRDHQKVMDRINQQRQDRQQQASGKKNRTEGTEEIPLPSSNESEPVDGVPPHQQKIYDSTSKIRQASEEANQTNEEVDTPQVPDVTSSTPIIRTRRSPWRNHIREVQRPLREQREAQERDQLNQLLEGGKIGVKIEDKDH